MDTFEVWWVKNGIKLKPDAGKLAENFVQKRKDWAKSAWDAGHQAGYSEGCDAGFEDGQNSMEK
jgi:hypothetical protein